MVDPRRALAVAALLLLWLPVLLARLPGREDPAGLPVQARVEADLAGRMARLADLASPPLPSPVRGLLEEGAVAMLDQGLEHRPTSTDLVLRRALLSARGGDRTGALARLAVLTGQGRLPAVEILAGAWSGQSPADASARATLQGELTGYYRYLAAVQVGDSGTSEGLRLQEARAARADQGRLGLLAVLTVGNLGAGLLCLALGPTLLRRWRSPAPESPPSLPLPRCLAVFVALQYLGPLAGGPLLVALGILGLPPLFRTAAAQLLLYLLGLALLLRLVPAPAVRTLGLGRLDWKAAGAGLVGFWMALPTVLATSWLSSLVLGRSPFSSNPVLEMVLHASPAAWVALGLMATVPGPLFEELVFRGLLFGTLRGSLGPAGAVLFSALAFALVHGDPQALLVLAALGALFAWLYQRTGSLWPAVIAHGLWNGTTLAVMALALAGT